MGAGCYFFPLAFLEQCYKIIIFIFYFRTAIFQITEAKWACDLSQSHDSMTNCTPQVKVTCCTCDDSILPLVQIGIFLWSDVTYHNEFKTNKNNIVPRVKLNHIIEKKENNLFKVIGKMLLFAKKRNNVPNKNHGRDNY